MPSTFMSHPQELEDVVYRELLSVESNCALDTGNGENRQRLVWNMDYSIFTVNKQILREALEAFYQENVLVSISANSCQFLRRHINKVIPVYYTGKKSFPDTALHIHLRHGHALSIKYWVESGCDCCENYTTWICHRRPHKQTPRTEYEYALFGIDFSFSNSSKQYAKTQSLAPQLAEALGGLRIPRDHNAHMGPQGSDYDGMDE
ncbi:hypothetical protein HYALB_00008612 [Hymenoscyphus albidus]|uniref:Uncharacterized protein n=1 Tax=Hymenoscyphus albidus TaxID=595503 RepID=A0A9N9L9J5_9HELO|nr:hypothetical protein HYALB_00008612 [Hymenoscyphus albidus]